MVDLALPWLLLASAATALLGAIGGLGGAVFLVPLLLLLGVPPTLAAPLGMLSVAAGSLAAGPRQLESGLVHHRLGVTIETTAAAGVIAGAALSLEASRSVFAYTLAAIAVGAALPGLRAATVRHRPQPIFVDEPAGEWPGTLAGSYLLDDEPVPYQARRLPAGLAAMTIAGVVSGFSGVGGGFIKTPVLREVMAIPVRVAAATSTFTVGITASTALIAFAAQGRIDARAGAAVVLGGLVGGSGGARLQNRLSPVSTRRLVSSLLLGVAAVLVVTA